MTIRFLPLLTVAIHHGYYADACADFDFIMPPSTARDLQGGRLLARVMDGQLRVLFEADAQGAPVSSLVGRTLIFGLRLLNSSFGNFTAPILADSTLLPFYANANNVAALDAPRGVVLTSGVHTYVPQTTRRPLTLQLSDSAGAVVATQTLAAGVANGSFDLRSLPDGAYRIDEDAGAGNVASSQLYVSAELRSAGAWGILAIKIDASFYAAPSAFTINYAARREQLKYFVVASNFTATEFDQLNVSDLGFGDESRVELIFDKIPPASFTEDDIAPALLGDDTSRIAMFRSQALVARRERGLRKLQLSRNGDVLVESLPLPGADRAQAHLIIHLTKP
jgi:hypothetical protein